jgi:hypothetical protein
LVSALGDRAEVYDALSLEVPPLPHGDFTPTSQFVRILQPNGELAPPPLLLEGAEGLDASVFQSAWSAVLKELRATGRLSARNVAAFEKGVADYRLQCGAAFRADAGHSGVFEVRKYLRSLATLSDALYRPQQRAQIQLYFEHGGYAFNGDSVLGLITHMLQHRVTPAQGSTAQLALAELARPISRVLEQEIGIHYERIDSLAAGEGHRPYAAEYRRNDDLTSSESNRGISRSLP